METVIEKEIMIRRCKIDDFGGLEKLIRELHEESLSGYRLPFQEEMLCEAIKKNYLNGLVMEIDNQIVGAIAGTIIDYVIGNMKIFLELVWYVNKQYRKHSLMLLRALEERLKAEGIIKAIIIVAIDNLTKEKTGRAFKMMGYKLLETHYIRILE